MMISCTCTQWNDYSSQTNSQIISLQSYHLCVCDKNIRYLLSWQISSIQYGIINFLNMTPKAQAIKAKINK